MFPNPESRTSFASFAHRAFVLFVIARLLSVIAIEMVSVSVGWQVYEITHRPLDLGLVGLAECIPGILLFLVAGNAADHFSRKRLLVTCYLGYGLCATLLLHFALRGVTTVTPIYVAVFLLGTVRTFDNPARSALLTEIVPTELFPTAVAWQGSILKMATLTGPMLGGFIYTLAGGPRPVYLTGAIASVIAAAVAVLIVGRKRAARMSRPNLRSMLAGLHYIHGHRIILGAISLDLFAVLLGGAVALLPVYARDILKTGPWGLGLLRSAPGTGAMLMGVLVAHVRLQKVGKVMLSCIVVFGTATVIFGLSHNLLLSLAALLILGAGDMVSVIIRQTLVQVATPDDMRGRVSAVNSLFVSTSNQLGAFESGVTAAWFGTVPAVVLGGLGSIVVAALWAWLFPVLRNADQLTVEELRPGAAARVSPG